MSGNDAPKVTFFESPVSGWAQVPYNTREVLTESGEWTSPITGYVKATCIGGGQAGASYSSTSTIIHTITPGGDTSFAGILARGGAGNYGGYAGEVVTDYVKVTAGSHYAYVVGGGGAVANTGPLSAEVLSTKCQLYPNMGAQNSYGRSDLYAYMCPGQGGNNGTPYGGGAPSGVSGAGAHPIKICGIGGAGNGAVSAKASSGGHGGPGAIILEYADPKKKD